MELKEPGGYVCERANNYGIHSMELKARPEFSHFGVAA